jgi:hypothetical protein
MPLNNRRVRFLDAIGSPKAVRFIFAGMVIYALVIGGLMLGYANVQSCLARYSDESAKASQVRLSAAAQDRTLNNRTEAVNTSDRQRIIANQRATQTLIESLLEEGDGERLAFLAFNKVNDESLRVFAANERERMDINTERLRVERLRATAPAPDAPSETC